MSRIRSLSALAAASLVSAAAFAATPPANHHPELNAIAGAVKASNLHAIDVALVGFGTRNTTLLLKSETRGIVAARHWAAAQFEKISKECDGCIEVVTPTQAFVGPRIPQAAGVPITDVVAIQRGTTDPGRVIVMTAHIDSINSNGFKTHWKDNRGDAPGANDDGAGVSALIETARVLSHYKFPATLVYSADSGEEQGLYGGSIIAQYAVDQGWDVETNINNDMVGNDHGGNGAYDPHTIRVFSEGTKSNETLKQAAMARFLGSEVDSPSRNIARYMQALAGEYLPGFKAELIYRTDRWGRSGDQVPFLEQGFPAVRLSESNEDYDRQHQDVRVENGVHYGDVVSGVDFDYLANVTRLDAITTASLAMAPMPPSGLTAKGAVAYDTTLSWKRSPGAASYNAWWRETTAPQWQHVQSAGDADSVVLKNVILDDWFFGVSAVSKDGWESPVEFPRFTGSFERSPKLGPDGKPADVRYPSPFGKFSGHAVGPASWRKVQSSDSHAH
ncbi:MAG TPA: M28 family peptidase [Rhodanobacteraceae bacterium]|nr:M28 family peptidase [Rhodanobacteraceae bacterium]